MVKKPFKIKCRSASEFKKQSATNAKIHEIVGNESFQMVFRHTGGPVCGISKGDRLYMATYFGCKDPYAEILSPYELRQYFKPHDSETTSVSTLEDTFKIFLEQCTDMSHGVTDFESLLEWKAKHKSKIRDQIRSLHDEIRKLENLIK